MTAAKIETDLEASPRLTSLTDTIHIGDQSQHWYRKQSSGLSMSPVGVMSVFQGERDGGAQA